MKSFRISIAVLTVLTLGSSFSTASRADEVDAPRPVPTTHNPDKVFAPPGFDSNDNAELVLTGTFMNTCYTVATPEVSVDETKKTITIQDRAYSPAPNNSWCLMVLVPYQKTIQLGQLNAGEYEILVHQEDGKIESAAKMPVAMAKQPSRDDLHYAAVTSARIERGPLPLQPTLKLEMQFTDRCTRIKEIKVLYRAKNIAEVLPVIELVSGPNCGRATVPASEQVKLELPWTGETLIHIRSAGGQSFNVVYDVAEEAGLI